jgi:hypothetical protein
VNLVRLKNAQFSDEANVNNVSYRPHPDGAFYVPEDVAEALCGDGRSGFYRAPDHRAPVGSVSEEQVESMIAGLEPGRLKQALSAALVGLSLKATWSPSPLCRSPSIRDHAGAGCASSGRLFVDSSNPGFRRSPIPRRSSGLMIGRGEAIRSLLPGETGARRHR